jgi:hypothetical protein
MYTLRTIETDGREVNLYLGKHYTIIRKDECETPEFNFKIEQFFGGYSSEKEMSQTEIEEREKIKAFIDAENLPNSLPIYWNKKHYIVNESGKTFQKL